MTRSSIAAWPGRWGRSTARHGAIIVVGDASDDVDPWTRVGRVQTRLVEHGVGAGDVVVAAGTTCYETVFLTLAAWGCGAAVSLVPAGRRIDAVATARELEERTRVLGARAVVADHPILCRLAIDDGGCKLWAFDDIRGWAASAPDGPEGFDPPRLTGPPHTDALDQVAIYQATSGTTGTSRLVPVTWRMLATNLEAIARRLDLGPEDRFVSWLPLFHDMGLVGFLALPLYVGADIALIPTDEFARAPWLLGQAIERYRGTMTGGPTYGVAMLEHGLRRGGPYDLSSLRIYACGAERIDLDICRRLIDAGGPHRLRPDVFAFAYGLAEATVAVSVTEPTTADNSEGTIALTGRPLWGTEVRVVDPTSGSVLGEHATGEIEVRGDSVMVGYVGAAVDESAPDPDGWWRTGDLGYVSGGQVAIVGRSKDVIVAAGRTFVPEEIEKVVASLPGVRPGRVAAVQISGRAGEGVGVVAEIIEDHAVDASVVRTAVHGALGVTPEMVVLGGRGTVPTTTSGKIRRAGCRQLLAGRAASPAAVGGGGR